MFYLNGLFFTLLIRCMGITLIILMIWHVVLSGIMSVQLEKNIQRRLLVSEKLSDIREYEKRQTGILASQARLNFMATLRHQNEAAAHVLKILHQTTVAPIELSRVKWQDRVLWVEGYVSSDLDLTAWIDAISHSSLLMHPVITSLSDKGQLKYFQLRIGLK